MANGRARHSVRAVGRGITNQTIYDTRGARRTARPAGGGPGPGGADWQSAVSRIGNPQAGRSQTNGEKVGSSAFCSIQRTGLKLDSFGVFLIPPAPS